VWPYRARAKGAVENLVGFVKESFFKGRGFQNPGSCTLCCRPCRVRMLKKHSMRFTPQAGTMS
jgi:transposase